ncbi:hematopoietic progenitor cell antigen CD34 [Otolemur garnettii]|uniref:hematopoietic progenitor cell antigen CD34 n=1 Tax=Otolemur garnettii TaxID=30611 RepID=UPI000C7F2F16|nr:hematopoietic progenitor cell antigen CD34 [Otolemur garnettii]
MLVRRSARAGPGMPRGWTALCLLSLLPSVFTSTNNLTTITRESSTPQTFSVVPTNVSHGQTATPSTSVGSTSPLPVSLGSNRTTEIISETTANFTSTSVVTPVLTTTNSSDQSQTSLVVTASTTLAKFSTSEMTRKPSISPGVVSGPSLIHTSFKPSPTEPYITPSPTTSTIKGEIKCSGIKEVRLTQGICLELNETSSCEDFKKDKGEDLAQVLCREEQADAKDGARVCSLLLAQSEVKPQCLLLVLANRTEIFNKLQLLKKHQSDLRKLGIQGVTEQDVVSHQSYSRKTLIALVTSGILLAVLGLTGYFLMNRRSWSPTGERLVSPGIQGKGIEEDRVFWGGPWIVNRGAQENGTGQATSRNGHSARQHVVADTEL